MITESHDSRTLPEFIKDYESVSEKTFKKLSRQVLEALNHLHTNNFIHRGVSNNTVFIN